MERKDTDKVRTGVEIPHTVVLACVSYACMRVSYEEVDKWRISAQQGITLLLGLSGISARTAHGAS
jgi:hypothetical protein